MSLILVVKIRSVYGQEMIYPVCDRAQAYVKALGLKTFTSNAISAAKSLGYKLTTLSETVEI